MTKLWNIKLNTMDENHPDVGLSYNNIGTAYKEKGDYVKALEYYNKAPTITCPLCTDNRETMISSRMLYKISLHPTQNIR